MPKKKINNEKSTTKEQNANEEKKQSGGLLSSLRNLAGYANPFSYISGNDERDGEENEKLIENENKDANEEKEEESTNTKKRRKRKKKKKDNYEENSAKIESGEVLEKGGSLEKEKENEKENLDIDQIKKENEELIKKIDEYTKDTNIMYITTIDTDKLASKLNLEKHTELKSKVQDSIGYHVYSKFANNNEIKDVGVIIFCSFLDEKTKKNKSVWKIIQKIQKIQKEKEFKNTIQFDDYNSNFEFKCSEIIKCANKEEEKNLNKLYKCILEMMRNGKKITIQLNEGVEILKEKEEKEEKEENEEEIEIENKENIEEKEKEKENEEKEEKENKENIIQEKENIIPEVKEDKQKNIEENQENKNENENEKNIEENQENEENIEEKENKEKEENKEKKENKNIVIIQEEKNDEKEKNVKEKYDKNKNENEENIEEKEEKKENKEKKDIVNDEKDDKNENENEKDEKDENIKEEKKENQEKNNENKNEENIVIQNYDPAKNLTDILTSKSTKQLVNEFLDSVNKGTKEEVKKCIDDFYKVISTNLAGFGIDLKKPSKKDDYLQKLTGTFKNNAKKIANKFPVWSFALADGLKNSYFYKRLNGEIDKNEDFIEINSKEKRSNIIKRFGKGFVNFFTGKPGKHKTIDQVNSVLKKYSEPWAIAWVLSRENNEPISENSMIAELDKICANKKDDDFNNALNEFLNKVGAKVKNDEGDKFGGLSDIFGDASGSSKIKKRVKSIYKRLNKIHENEKNYNIPNGNSNIMKELSDEKNKGFFSGFFGLFSRKKK